MRFFKREKPKKEETQQAKCKFKITEIKGLIEGNNIILYFDEKKFLGDSLILYLHKDDVNKLHKIIHTMENGVDEPE